MCHFHNLASSDRGFLSYLALSLHVSQLFMVLSPFMMNYSTIPLGDRKRAYENVRLKGNGRPPRCAIPGTGTRNNSPLQAKIGPLKDPKRKPITP